MLDPSDRAGRILGRIGRSKPTRWGHSLWARLEACPKKYELRYLRHVVPREMPRAPRIGIAAHRGLEAGRWIEREARLGRTLPPDLPTRAVEQGDDPEDVKLEALRLVVGHEHYWESHDPLYTEVMGIEKQVQGSIGGVPYSTRYDATVKSGKRVHLVMEHKTASRSSGDAQTEFQANGQAIGHAALWPGPGDDIPAVLVNRLIKTAVPQYERFMVVYTDLQIRRFARDLAALNSDRERYERRRFFPRRLGSCVQRYGLCEFFGLCHGGAAKKDDYYYPHGLDWGEALR